MNWVPLSGFSSSADRRVQLRVLHHHDVPGIPHETASAPLRAITQLIPVRKSSMSAAVTARLDQPAVAPLSWPFEYFVVQK